LILFARFVPFGAVGTMRLWRSKVVQVVPRIPVPAEYGSKGSGDSETTPTSVPSADSAPTGSDEPAS
jgi:hypothetical protein